MIWCILFRKRLAARNNIGPAVVIHAAP